MPHHEGVRNTAHCHQWKEAELVPGRGVPGQHTSVYLRPEEETTILHIEKLWLTSSKH